MQRKFRVNALWSQKPVLSAISASGCSVVVSRCNASSMRSDSPSGKNAARNIHRHVWVEFRGLLRIEHFRGHSERVRLFHRRRFFVERVPGFAEHQ